MIRVTLVSDRSDFCIRIIENMREDGFDAYCIDDVSELLAEIAVYLPDVLVVDLSSDGVSAASVLRHVRSSSKFQRLGVIVVADANASDRRLECVISGADAFLVMPLARQELSI